jgi:transcriptional regulator with PAS, ATPase and Fis domain
MHLQAKLLRVLEDEKIYQLGNNQPQKVDVRVVAATNKDLWKEVQEDRFRKDLYFRLKGTMLQIPPLRERKEDIMPLVWHFVSIFNNVFEKKITRITKDAEAYLMEYPWEGNVRELKNTIKSIFTFKNSDSITVKDLMLTLHVSEREIKKSFVALQEFELNYIKEVLEANQFNIQKTAKILDISRSRLYRKLKLLDIDINEEWNDQKENG